MSTGMPPAAEVASMITRASSALPAGRSITVATPVDVSLCGHAHTSTDGPAAGRGADPGPASTISDSARNGAVLVAVANFDPNSPNWAWEARDRTSPHAAASQNTVEPPLPSTTS